MGKYSASVIYFMRFSVLLLTILFFFGIITLIKPLQPLTDDDRKGSLKRITSIWKGKNHEKKNCNIIGSFAALGNRLR